MLTEEGTLTRHESLDMIQRTAREVFDIEADQLLLAGAPVDGAAIVFRAENRAMIEEFAQNDPYVTNGIVTDWFIREWTVVAGAAL